MEEIVVKFKSWRKKFENSQCRCCLKDVFFRAMDLCEKGQVYSNFFNNTLFDEYSLNQHWCCEYMWLKFNHLCSTHYDTYPEHYATFDEAKIMLDEFQKRVFKFYNMKQVDASSIRYEKDNHSEVATFALTQAVNNKNVARVYRYRNCWGNPVSSVYRFEWVR